MTKEARYVSARGKRRDLGVINWIICRIAARTVHAKDMHLFNVLGKHKLLFWSWLPYSGVLLGKGKLSRVHIETVILRTAYLRRCTYELQHHRRIARRAGIDDQTQQAIRLLRTFDLSYEQQALVKAVDELVLTRTWSHETRAWLANFLDAEQMLELCVLIGQYDALAATIAALQIPLDFEE